MSTLTPSRRRPRPTVTPPTIRECRLLALPENAAAQIEPDSALERGGRTYRVMLRESAGEVDYAFLRNGDDERAT